MSETKFTPGPWTLITHSGKDALIGAFEIRGMFFDKPGIYPIFQQSRSAIDGATVYLHPADAHLIAAAPDLYAALETALKTLELAETKVLVGDEGCIWPAEIARAALKKARGGQ